MPNYNQKSLHCLTHNIAIIVDSITSSACSIRFISCSSTISYAISPIVIVKCLKDVVETNGGSCGSSQL